MAKEAKLKSSKSKITPSKNVDTTIPKPAKVVQRVEESSDDEDEDEDELDIADGSNDDSSTDEDDSGVDQEGIKKLMDALGEDGLDEFAQAELRALTGDEESDEGDEDEEEAGDVGEESEEEENASNDGDEEEEASEGEDEEQGDEEEQAIPLDEAESVDEDVVPQQKVVIDNKIALERIRESIKLDPLLPWTETLTITYPESIDVDVDDDLNRELAFYKQALHAANTGKALAAKHNFPFTRPADYFAEMVKSDSHMERIRQRLLDESATIKRSEEKRKEREGKKFGKQVQMEKLKERQRSKKEMEERLKGLKRKRKDALDNAQEDNEGFDVAVEDAISNRPAKRGRTSGPDGKKRMPRAARDKKYGFGGAGKRSKQNTKDSTDAFVRSSNGGKGAVKKNNNASKRPGKSKRMAARSRS